MKRILKKHSAFFNLSVFPSCRFLITAFAFLGVAFTNHNTHADCVEPPPNMVAWWPGDDTPRDIVSSHHGTIHGTANYAPGEVLDGFSFDGSTGCYFSAPFVLTNSAFSVDLWVKAASATQAAYTSVISSSFPGRYDDTWQIDFDAFGNYRVQFGNDTLILDIGPVSTTAFQHIAVTYDPAIGGGAVVRSYLDGVLTDTDTWTGMPMVFEVAKIGANRGETVWFAGRVDEVEIFNRALSQTEIQAIYNAGSEGKCKPPPPPCVNPPFGMVGWWPGDGNFTDIAGGHNGSAVGDTTFALGMVDQAFSLDGSQDYVEVPDSPDLEFCPTCPLTVDLWAYRTGGGSVMHLIGKRGEFACSGSNTEGTYQMGWNPSPSPGHFFFGNPGGPQVDVFQDLPLNTWTHLTGTFDYDNSTRTGMLSFYINAVLTGVTTGNLGPVNNSTLRIGGSGACNTFPGLLDEVEIFNRALSPEEILGIYNAGSAGKCKPPPTPTPTPGPCVDPPPDMVAWWPGDNTPSDIIGGYNGTLADNATFGSGLVAQAFSFDGAGDWVEVPTAPAFEFGPISPMTIDFWAYRTSNAHDMHMIGKRLPCDPTPYTYQILWYTDGLVAFGSPSVGVYTDQNNLFPLNTWTHIAASYEYESTGTAKIYINGQLHGTATGLLGPANSYPLRIGGSGDCESFAGLMDEVEIFNRALSQTEIQAIYNAGSAGKCKTTPTPTPTATATATATFTPTPTATATFTPTPTATATFTPTATATATATATFTPTPTATATFTPTPTATATFTPTPTSTPAPTPTPTSTPTPTPTPTPACAAQVQPPINTDGSSVWTVRRGVVPVKFRLTCDGNPTCDLPPATIAVTRTAGGVIGEINESVYSSPADSGPNFRVLECQYHYNLNSSALGVGTYRVDILINSQVVGSAAFQLK